MNFVGRRTIPDTLTDGLATLDRQLSAEYLNRSPD
jgi:hypothetical protein